MGLKSHIKLFKTFFTQLNETSTQQIMGVKGSTITAYTSSGYLRFFDIETGVLDGFYPFDQLEILSMLIEDNVCKASDSFVKYGKVKLSFYPLSDYMVADYSKLDANLELQTEEVQIDYFLDGLKSVLPFTDSKSFTSVCVVHDEFFYAHNGIVLIKKPSGCSLSFQLAPSIWKIMLEFLSIQSDKTAVFEIQQNAVLIKTQTSKIVLPLLDKAESTAKLIESVFQSSRDLDKSFQFDFCAVQEGLKALSLVKDPETKILVVEETQKETYTIKSVCSTVRLEDLTKKEKLFNFSARFVWLDLCLKHLNPTSLQVQPLFDSEGKYTSSILFSDFAKDCEILMSCVIT
jgi:hypothetical protein